MSIRCSLRRASRALRAACGAMRLGAKPDGLIERLGLAANLIPVPLGESMFGMPVAR